MEMFYVDGDIIYIIKSITSIFEIELQHVKQTAVDNN